MNDSTSPITEPAAGNVKDAVDLIGGLFNVARPGAVFGEPITQGEITVITANEVSVGMGFGFGGGSDTGKPEETAVEDDAPDEAKRPTVSAGGGGGGGGASSARPVAVILIGPDGVHVEPIVDVTKIAITLFTVIGAFLLALAKRRR